MRKITARNIWILAFLLAGFATGCGREQVIAPIPTVIAVSPANGATAVVLNTVVSAGFSSVMAAATINTGTFTLSGPGGVGVAGTVSYAGTTATFTPAVSLAANSLYIATITTGAQDPAGDALAANYSWSFTTGPPTVISTVPASGATAVPVNAAISATFSEAMNAATLNNATFLVTGPGGAAVAGTVTYSGSTATFTPSALLGTATFTATITTGAKDPAGVALAANYVWSFTTAPPPTVVSTVPLTGATAVPVNTVVSATFSEAMNPATITAATFTLDGPGATAVTGAVTYAGTTATFTPTAVLAASTLFTATITTGAQDPTGVGLTANYVWTFTTAAPPTVVSTIPANGATAVPTNSVVSATFSEAMAPASITATTFTLSGPGTTPVAGAVTYAGTIATFTPTAALAGGTLFTAIITTGATDPTGNPLAANFVWTFTTEGQPAVTSTNPISAAVNVPINQKITATFGEPMSAATIIAPTTVTLATTTGATPVTAAVIYDAASDTAILTPAANLAPSTQYTATITTAAHNPAGKALAANYVWSFTTGTVADASAPTVFSTNPADVATNVPPNQKIAAVFSKAMNPVTISAPGAFSLMTTVGAVPVTGTVTYDTASNTAIFTPTANLANSTQFTATISSAVTDLSGNALATGGATNPWTFTTGTTLDVTAPTVTVTNPADAATAVPVSTTISATFSTAMNPTTITTESFLVTATADGTPVSGTVAYDPADQIATFTPSADLDASTQYTAAISPAVEDLAGNALVAGLVPNPWSFTTGTGTGTALAPINLGSAGNFAIMANAAITTTGGGIVNGDAGLGGAGSDGLSPSQVNGTIYGPGPVVTQAETDLLTAYNQAVADSANSTTETDIGGLTLTPGLYVASTTLDISTNVTLDAQGNPNAVFVFKVGSSLTTAGSVILAGGAKASNIFWQIGASATIANATTFEGSILANTSITVGTTAIVNGRLLAGSGPGGAGSVTFDGTSVSVPQQ
ncbi:MAG: Ig-like domain-containing protein [Candidatus Acidiferrales bacterium]